MKTLKFTAKDTKLNLSDGFNLGRVFKKTHFYIDTPAYRKKTAHGNSIGFDNDADREAFEGELRALLEPLGFSFEERKIFGSAGKVVKDESTLYLHPDDISGVVEVDMISQIQNVLSEASTFSLRHVETNAEYELITQEELENRVQLANYQIAKVLFETFKTKNKRTYLPEAQLYTSMKKLNGFSFNNTDLIQATVTHLKEVLMSLVDQGLIKQTSLGGTTGFRSLMKSELKATHRHMMAKWEDNETDFFSDNSMLDVNVR